MVANKAVKMRVVYKRATTPGTTTSKEPINQTRPAGKPGASLLWFRRFSFRSQNLLSCITVGYG